MGQKVQWTGNCVVCLYSHQVSLSDIIGVLTDINQDLRLQPNTRLIHDFSKALHIDPGAAALLTLAAHSLGQAEENLTVKTAVVSSDEGFLAMVRNFESQSAREIRAFSSLALARSWLGLD